MHSMRRFNVLLAISLATTMIGIAAHATSEIDSEINDLQVQLVKRPAPGVPLAKKIAVKKKKFKSVSQAPVWHSDITDNSISALPAGPPPAPSDAPRALDK